MKTHIVYLFLTSPLKVTVLRKTEQATCRQLKKKEHTQKKKRKRNEENNLLFLKKQREFDSGCFDVIF